MVRKLNGICLTFSLALFSRLMFINPQASFAAGEKVSVSRSDMLNVAKELHPPGCTDSMTADYCTLSTGYDLRKEIWSLLEGGMDKKQVIEYLVQKYDERILAAPAPEGFNLIAWALPVVGLAIGAILILFLIKKWKKELSDSIEVPKEELGTEHETEKVQEELKKWL